MKEGCNRVYWVCGSKGNYAEVDSNPFRKQYFVNYPKDHCGVLWGLGTGLFLE